MTAYAANEIEGILMENAEQRYGEYGFKLISTGGYYHSLPMDTLRPSVDFAGRCETR
jgi:glutamine synthetase